MPKPSSIRASEGADKLLVLLRPDPAPVDAEARASKAFRRDGLRESDRGIVELTEQQRLREPGAVLKSPELEIEDDEHRVFAGR